MKVCYRQVTQEFRHKPEDLLKLAQCCCDYFLGILLKELSHGILSCIGHVQNYLQIEGKLKIVVC